MSCRPSRRFASRHTRTYIRGYSIARYAKRQTPRPLLVVMSNIIHIITNIIIIIIRTVQRFISHAQMTCHVG